MVTPPRRGSVDRIASALVALEAAGPDVAALARGLVTALLDAHGEGLSAVVRLVHEHVPDPAPVLSALVADPLVADLLVLHGLHPDDATTRAERAVRDAMALLGPEASGAAVVEVGPERVKLRLGADRPEVRQAIHRAVADAVPDLRVEVVDNPEDRRRLLPVIT